MRPTLPSFIKILVPVKRSIDYAVCVQTGNLGLVLTFCRKIRIASDGKGVDTNVKHSMVSLNNASTAEVQESIRRDRLVLAFATHDMLTPV